MTVLKQTEKWFKRAKKDLHSARLVAKGREWEDVCFHSQQAAEKALKGYLVQHGIDPPKIHKLWMLCKMCAKYNLSFEQFRQRCHSLTPYAVEFRYVDADEIDAVQARQAYRDAETIYRFCRQQIIDEHQ